MPTKTDPQLPLATGPRREAALIVLLSALTAFGPLSIDMYLPGLPTLASDLGVSPARAQLTLSAFFLGFGGGQLIYGPLSDRFGRRAPLIGGLLLFTAAGLGCALATSLEALVAYRFLQAVGGCAGPVIARAVVRDLYGRDRAARVLSLMVLIIGIAPALAPLVGGQILLFAGWRAIFWLLIILGTLSVIAAGLMLPETLPAGRRVHGSAWTLILAYGEPFSHPRYLGYAISGAFVYGGMFAYITGSPFVFITLHGVPPERFGFIFGTNVLGILAAATINSYIVMRFGVDRILSAGVLAAAVFGVALGLVAAFDWGGFPALLVPLFGFVACIGFVGANAMAGCLGLFPTRAGVASGLAGTLQFTAGALCGALVGLVADGSARPMATVIALAGLGSLAVHRALVR